jgi:hypothetical protein
VIEIDRRYLRTVLGRLLGAVPPGTGILLLGNTAGLMHRVPAVAQTKDVDISLVLLVEKRRIAPRSVVAAFLANVGGEITKHPADGSWIQLVLPIGDREVKVDVIRGKSRDRAGGTFLARNVLQAIAERASRRDQELLPDLTDLVVMKAWATTDQDRHLRSDPTNEYHLLRRRAYFDDARRYAEVALDRGALDVARMEELLGLMRDDRRRLVRVVLEEAGALERP